MELWLESLVCKKKIYEPTKYMGVNQAMDKLVSIMEEVN